MGWKRWARARSCKTLKAVGQGAPLGFKHGNDMIRFGFQEAHSGWWLQNRFSIILRIKRTDTVGLSTEQIADMFQLLLVFSGPAEGMSMHRTPSSNVQGNRRKPRQQSVMEAKKAILMSSVKWCRAVGIIPGKYPLDLLSWRSLANLLGAVSSSIQQQGMRTKSNCTDVKCAVSSNSQAIFI